MTDAESKSPDPVAPKPETPEAPEQDNRVRCAAPPCQKVLEGDELGEGNQPRNIVQAFGLSFPLCNRCAKVGAIAWDVLRVIREAKSLTAKP